MESNTTDDEVEKKVHKAMSGDLETTLSSSRLPCWVRPQAENRVLYYTNHIGVGFSAALTQKLVTLMCFRLN